MPNVVVVGGEIQCSHGGLLQLASGSDLLEIAGAAAVTSGMEVGLSFAQGVPGVIVFCPNAAPSGPPGSSPCTITTKATAGISTELTIGGLGVLLDNASGPATNPNGPPPTWSVAQAGQTLVSVDQ